MDITLAFQANDLSSILSTRSTLCEYGEIGRRKGFKIPRSNPSQFDSGYSYQTN